MGARGPKPQPAVVRRLRGNLGREALADLQDGVQATVEIPGCPKHLLPEAQKEWKRITPELEQLGLIAKIDRAALALYCQAWARWVWCETRLKAAMDLAEQKREAFEAGELRKVDEAAAKSETYAALEWAGGDGFQVPTPNGALTYSPYWVGANKAADQVDKFLQSFGMSPSSRSRVSSSDVYPWLPGMEPKKPDAAGAGAETKVTSLADFKKPR